MEAKQQQHEGACVHFDRGTFGMFVTPVIHIDDKISESIAAVSEVCVTGIPAGKHRFWVTGGENEIFHAKVNTEVDHELKDGETYYFDVYVSMGILLGRCRIKEKDDAWHEKHHPNKPGHLKTVQYPK